MWEYSNETLQLRVHASDTCLVWTQKSEDGLANLSLEICRDTINQKFQLDPPRKCTCNLTTVLGHVLKIAQDSSRIQQVDVRPSPKIKNHSSTNNRNQSMDDHTNADGMANGWKNLRNLSSITLKWNSFVCPRFGVVNGDLIPTPFNAPVFFPGDVMTILCNEDYTLKTSGEDRAILKCRKSRSWKKICRDDFDEKKSHIPTYIVLSLLSVCCVTALCAVVCNLRRESAVLKATNDVVENNGDANTINREDSKNRDEKGDLEEEALSQNDTRNGANKAIVSTIGENVEEENDSVVG